MNRDAALTRLRERQTPWDLIVIGGGATGVAIAMDAASRGLDVALFEQSDFGKGTSSRSTKLVHGGIRYLKQGNLSLVKDALRERTYLRNNAPHLVHDQPFLIPCQNLWEQLKYGTGLKLYDFLAIKDSFPSSQRISSTEAQELAPTIRADQLRGGVVYHDGQFDDARLLLSMAITAWKHGACLLNYSPVQKIIKSNAGRAAGVVIEDFETGESLDIRGTVVINAGGPFSDAVRKLDDAGCESMIAPSQGVHLVVGRKHFPGETALIVPKTRDGRVIFVIPWHQHVIIGTTDTPLEEAVLEPDPREGEIPFLIETANQYFASPITHADILSIYTGIRPLVKQGTGGPTSQMSRDHVIRVSNSGLITIAGGKWTTVRKMAEDCVDYAVKQGELSARECQTTKLRLFDFSEEKGPMTHRSAYGAVQRELEHVEATNPELRETFGEDLPVRRSEVAWACREEMARTLDDVLSRRTRMLLLNSASTKRVARDVACLMAHELRRGESWIEDQVTEFNKVCQHYLP